MGYYSIVVWRSVIKIDHEVFGFAKKMTTLTYSFMSKAVQNFLVALYIPY